MIIRYRFAYLFGASTLLLSERRSSARSLSVGVVYSPAVLLHRCSSPHPECPERVSSIREHLCKDSTRLELEWLEPGLDDSSDLMQRLHSVIAEVHWDEYIKELQLRCQQGGGSIDYDTYLNKHSFDGAVAASACWVEAVRRTRERGQGPTFALARPPGHHATRSQGMGFCLINHAAIAARYALDYCDVERVAILDFDVHHGNGIESIARKEPRITYCSVHEGNIFPFTGEAKFRGVHKNILNVPVAAHSDWRVYEQKLDNVIIPFLLESKPDLVLVSAGYDALDSDELASVSLLPEDFGKMTKKVVDAFGRERVGPRFGGRIQLEGYPLSSRGNSEGSPMRLQGGRARRKASQRMWKSREF